VLIGGRPSAGGVAFLAASLFAATGLASPSARLVYSRTADAASCPGEAALRSAVAARFGYDPFFSWAKQTIVVQILRQRGHYVARLQLLDDQGVAHGSRELTSEQPGCSEIFEASALAVGIALDAASDAVSSQDPAVGAPPAPSAAPAASAQPPPPPAPAPPPPLPEPPVRPRPRPSWSVFVDALGAAGSAPSPAPGVAVGAAIAVRAWSLALELRADASEGATRPASLGGGAVESSLYAAQLVPCWTISYFAICGLGVLGALEASGTDIVPSTTRTTLFAAAGARIGVEWPLPAGFGLRLHTDGLVDLHRPTLALGQDGEDDVWTAPQLAGAVGIGVAKHFQ
jgi:hypothetical protein